MEAGNIATFKSYLQNFDSEFSCAGLRFSVGIDPNHTNANAVTYQPNNYLMTIMFNPNKLFRPRLDVARTLIHELIHAEIYRELLSLSEQGSIAWSIEFIQSIKADYPQLYEYYMRYKYNIPPGGVITSAQHELMADHYRGIITQALIEFDPTLPYNYDWLAWPGLMGSGTFDSGTAMYSNPTQAWQLTPLTERLQIKSNYDNFILNTPPCQP